MASYHLTAKFGSKGKAAPHADYIAREGKYSERKRYEDIDAKGYGNMPAWAGHNTALFWEAADEYERANGSTYRELEVALPRELNNEQRLALVQDFINQEIGENQAYQFAIHNPNAAIDKGEQPHAHIMYSERLNDGVERAKDQYFKRHNAKNPEKGGAKKLVRGETPKEIKDDLLATRKRWADIQNHHLKKHGHSERVTHLSLEDQGIERTPEKHIGTQAYKMNAKDKTALVEYRASVREHTETLAELSKINLANAIRTEKRQREERELAYALMQKIVEESRLRLEQREWERVDRRNLRERMEQAERERQTIPEKKGEEWQTNKEAEIKLSDEQQAEKAEKLITIYTEQARNQWRTDETNKIKAEAQKLRDDAQKLQASEPEKPKLFGRAEWERKHNELEADVRYANKKAKEMEEGISWALRGGQEWQFTNEGKARLEKEDPALYKIWQDVRKKQKQAQKQAQQKGKDWDLER